MSDVAAPAVAVGHDAQVTLEEVLAILRLTEQDVDVARIEQLLIPAGLARIETDVDAATPFAWTALLQWALVTVVVDTYQTKSDGVIVSSTVTGALVRGGVLPAKQRWGIS